MQQDRKLFMRGLARAPKQADRYEYLYLVMYSTAHFCCPIVCKKVSILVVIVGFSRAMLPSSFCRVHNTTKHLHLAGESGPRKSENGNLTTSTTAARSGKCWTWDTWKELLEGKVPEGAALPREAVIVQRLLYWMAQDDVPAAFLHISHQIEEYSGGSGGFLCKSPPPIALGSFTFSAWIRLGRHDSKVESGAPGLVSTSFCLILFRAR